MRLAEPELADADWSKTWRLLSLPAASAQGASVVATPSGWIAVSSRHNGSKAPPPPDSFIYRSLDGTHWRAIPTNTGDAQLQNAEVAYGGGHYVITGSRGGANVVLDSSNGETWHEQALDDPNSWSQGPVKYVQGRFFFLNVSLLSSIDGQQWSRVDQPYPYAGLSDVAYGNGRYLGVGAGTLLSLDGRQWRAAPIDCSLAGDCITAPDDGTIPEEGAGPVFFAEERFHALSFGAAEGAFSSPDGESWQFTPGLSPDGYLSGHFVRSFGPEPKVWVAKDGPSRALKLLHRSSMLPSGITPAEAQRWNSPAEPDATHNAFPLDETMPAEMDLSWSDQLDCTTARCFVVTSGTASQLLLVP